MSNLRIGTRGSELALWQANHLKDSLENIGISSELVIIKTKGDADYRPLKDIAGDGFFTKALENELFANNIDLAIHSCKDLASMKIAALPWKAFSQRAETEDVLILKKSEAENKNLAGLRVGTSSPRRVAQLKQFYPKAEAKELRGNVPTRLMKAASDEYDAVILAKAGLMRLGLLENLPDELVAIDLDWVTAPCQGVLAIQGRQENLDKIDKLLDANLDRVAKIEKSLLAFLGGGCHMAVGAKISKDSSSYRLQFFFEDQDGKILNANRSYNSLDELEANIYTDLFMGEVNSTDSIVLTHNLSSHKKVYSLCKDKNIKAISLPMIEITSSIEPDIFVEDFKQLAHADALLFTSQNAVKIFLLEVINQNLDFESLKNKKIICIGKSTKAKLEAFGLECETPDEAHSSSLIDKLNKNFSETNRLLFVGSEDAQILKQRDKISAQLLPVFVYKSTSTAKSFSGTANTMISFASPLAVENFITENGQEMLKNYPIYAIGKTTSAKLEDYNLAHHLAPESGSWKSLLDSMTK